MSTASNIVDKNSAINNLAAKKLIQYVDTEEKRIAGRIKQGKERMQQGRKILKY